MSKLNEFRSAYPAYKDVPDDKLAGALYEKFYAGKVDRADFDQQIGQASPDFARQAASMSPIDLSVARTKRDAFGDYLRTQAAAPKPGETPEQTERRLYGSLSGTKRPGTGEGMLRATVKGLTFDAGDEIVAAGAAVLDALLRDEDFNRAYGARLGRERQLVDQFRKDSPVLAYGSEIAGAIPTAIATAPAAALASRWGRVGVGAATGLGQGAAYGFMGGEGGAAERGKSAAISGALGAGVGTLAPALGSATRSVVGGIQSLRNARSVGLPRGASDVLARVAGADDTLTGPGAQRLKRGGPDAMLADTGYNMRTLLDTATQRSGPAAAKARDAIEGRATKAGQDLVTALDDAFGPAQGVKSTETALRQGTQAGRGSAYDAAYSSQINYASPLGMQIEDIVRNRVPMEAITKANELMRGEGVKSARILAKAADDGTVTFERLPDVRQLDYITRALKDVADAADGQGLLGGTTNQGRIYGNLKTKLRGLVREAAPEYGKALDTAADPIAKREALKLGQKALAPGFMRDELAEELAGMSAAERDFVGKGLRAQIDEAMANVQRALTDTNMDAREAIKAIRTLSTRASHEKVEMLLGPLRAERLFNSIEQSLSAFELRAALADNSKTFTRTAMDAVVKSLDDGVIDAFRMGRPAEFGKRLAQVLMGRSPAARERSADETYSALAEVLTGPRGPQALDKLQALSTATMRSGPTVERARLLAEVLARRNAAVTGPSSQSLSE